MKIINVKQLDEDDSGFLMKVNVKEAMLIMTLVGTASASANVNPETSTTIHVMWPEFMKVIPYYTVFPNNSPVQIGAKLVPNVDTIMNEAENLFEANV